MKNVEEAKATSVTDGKGSRPEQLPPPPMLWLLIPLGLLVVLAMLSRT